MGHLSLTGRKTPAESASVRRGQARAPLVPVLADALVARSATRWIAETYRAKVNLTALRSALSSASSRLACDWRGSSSPPLAARRNGTGTSRQQTGGARGPPPSRSWVGRSHNRSPRSKKTFEAAGLRRRADLYRQPGTTMNLTPPPQPCPKRRPRSVACDRAVAFLARATRFADREAEPSVGTPQVCVKVGSACKSRLFTHRSD